MKFYRVRARLLVELGREGEAAIESNFKISTLYRHF